MVATEPALRILFLQGRASDTELAERELRQAGITFISRRVETKAAFLDAIHAFAPNLILADYTLPKYDGLAALSIARRESQDVPFIFLSNVESGELAIKVLENGATDIVPESDISRLPFAVRRAMREASEQAERRRIEHALRQSNTMLEELFEFAPDTILVTSRDGLIIRVNSAAERMFGYSHAELIGKPVEMLIPEHLGKKHKALRRDYMAEARVRPMGIGLQLYAKAKNRPEFPVDVTLGPLKTDDGLLVLAIIRDITKRREAERALQLSHRKYRDIIESAPIGVYQSTPEGEFITANAALAKMLGYESAEELMRLKLADDIYFDREQRARLIAQYEPLGSVVDLEVLWKKKDSSPIWIHLNAKAVRDANGKTLYFDGFVRDITERKRADVELFLQKTHFQQLFENAPVGIVMLDMSDRVLLINKGFERIFQYSMAEISGRSINQIIVPEAQVEEASDLSLRTLLGEAIEKEVTRQRKDGSLVPVQVYGVPIVVDEQAVGIYAMYVELTERRQLEEQLLQSQKMEAIGRLAGGVAHDFNNLLTAILGYSDLALGALAEGEPLRVSIEEIRSAGERAATLTRQLLAFSRKQVLQPKVLELNALIAESTNILRRLIGEDIELDTVLEPELGRVKADPGQIEQIVMNLAVNARDAMPKGGRLTISTANVCVGEDDARVPDSLRPGAQVMLSVTDTGIGMDEQTRSHIFEPFFTTKGPGKGTGLGLSTVYGIAHQSGGYIMVESDLGRGATFRVYLPRVDELAPQAQPRSVPTEKRRSPATILLVEDDDGVRKLACQTLQLKGYRVLEAANAGEALLTCKSHEGPIHLIVTDVVMPQMSGPELAIKLTALHGKTKILFLSGYTGDPIVQHGILESGTPFLQKPFTPDAFARKVEEVLDEV